jgi:hypothetical protein
MFPPDELALWDFTDDVWYARLVDNNGAGAVLWESEAYPASDLASFIYGNPLYPGEMNTTLDTGYYLDSFVITLTDSQVNAAIMDLRLEAYLFESPITPPLNPADPLRYSTITDDSEWQISFTIKPGEVKNFQLATKVSFPP